MNDILYKTKYDTWNKCFNVRKHYCITMFFVMLWDLDLIDMYFCKGYGSIINFIYNINRHLIWMNKLMNQWI